MQGGEERGPDPEAAYYQSIEEFFVSRRGDPLFLSNADWLLIRGWREAGIPLRVVLRGISDALDAHAHSWSRQSKVRRLAYCASAVEAAHEHWRRALSLGEEDGVNLRQALDGLIAALGTARDLDEPARGVLERVVERMARCAEDPGTPEQVDAWLRESECELLQAIERQRGRAEVQRVEAAVDGDLAPYAGRMPAAVLAQIRRDAVARRLLEQHGLPRLSLFHVS